MQNRVHRAEDSPVDFLHGFQPASVRVEALDSHPVRFSRQEVI